MKISKVTDYAALTKDIKPQTKQTKPLDSCFLMMVRSGSPPQFENRIMALVYIRSIMRSTVYQKAPFC